jgi:hypothetical protein
MKSLWKRFVSVFRRPGASMEEAPRRSAWVQVGTLPPDPGLQCHFCGRVKGDEVDTRDRGEEGPFALVQARYNPRLQHIVCGSCLQWNRISPT